MAAIAHGGGNQLLFRLLASWKKKTFTKYKLATYISPKYILDMFIVAETSAAKKIVQCSSTSELTQHE